MHRIIHFFLCKLGWHSKPKYNLLNFNVVGKCKWCKRTLRLDSKGSLFG